MMHLRKIVPGLFIVFFTTLSIAQEANVDSECVEFWSDFISLNRAYTGASPSEQVVIREKIYRMISDIRGQNFVPFGTESAYLLKFGDWLRNNVYYVNDFQIVGRSGPYVTKDGSQVIHDICYIVAVSNRFTPVKRYNYKVRFSMNRYGKISIVSIKSESECRFGRPPKDYKNLTGGLYKVTPVTIPEADPIPTETAETPVPVPTSTGEVPVVVSDECVECKKDALRYKNSANRLEKEKVRLTQTIKILNNNVDSIERLLTAERIENSKNKATIDIQNIKIDSLTRVANYLKALVDSTFCLNEWRTKCEDTGMRDQAIVDFSYFEQNMQLRPRDEKVRMIQKIYQTLKFSQCHTCIRPEEYCVIGKILLYYYSFIQDLLPGDSELEKKNFRISQIYEILNKGANLGPDYADVQCLQQIAEDINVVLEDRTQDNIEMIMNLIISDIKRGKFAAALYRYSIYQNEFPKYSESQTVMLLDMNISKVLLWDLGNISANKGSLRPGSWVYRVYNESGYREEFAKRKLVDVYKESTTNEKTRGECYILLQKYRK